MSSSAIRSSPRSIARCFSMTESTCSCMSIIYLPFQSTTHIMLFHHQHRHPPSHQMLPQMGVHAHNLCYPYRRTPSTSSCHSAIPSPPHLVLSLASRVVSRSSAVASRNDRAAKSRLEPLLATYGRSFPHDSSQ